MKATDAYLKELRDRLGRGRAQAVPGAILARDLSISERAVRVLVEELTSRGELIGSMCSGERPGYFLIQDEEDLRAGLAHIHSRAMSMLRRWGAVRRAAETRFSSHTVLTLFPESEFAEELPA